MHVNTKSASCSPCSFLYAASTLGESGEMRNAQIFLGKKPFADAHGQRSRNDCSHHSYTRARLNDTL